MKSPLKMFERVRDNYEYFQIFDDSDLENDEIDPDVKTLLMNQSSSTISKRFCINTYVLTT